MYTLIYIGSLHAPSTLGTTPRNFSVPGKGEGGGSTMPGAKVGFGTAQGRFVVLSVGYRYSGDRKKQLLLEPMRDRVDIR